MQSKRLWLSSWNRIIILLSSSQYLPLPPSHPHIEAIGDSAGIKNGIEVTQLKPTRLTLSPYLCTGHSYVPATVLGQGVQHWATTSLLPILIKLGACIGDRPKKKKHKNIHKWPAVINALRGRRGLALWVCHMAMWPRPELLKLCAQGPVVLSSLLRTDRSIQLVPRVTNHMSLIMPGLVFTLFNKIS